jgi:hypothetical protein
MLSDLSSKSWQHQELLMLVRDLVNRPPNKDAALDVEVLVQKVAQQ